MKERKRYKKVFALIALYLWMTCSWSEDSSPTPEFDCVAVFDFMAGLAAPNCALANKAGSRPSEIIAAVEILEKHKFLSPHDLNNISIEFCPLTYGLGIVPKANTIYLDDGLQAGSVDTLAEVVLHEYEHIAQMRELGSREFKCAYINELVACGGCIDKNHALEAPAYAKQAGVRNFLLQRWLKDNGN